ncbi:MAG: MraY family glycosyltransferase [Oligoflexia bacterium]|nr:MraY family glycosyltransferase [Oligoflexia bacterium]
MAAHRFMALSHIDARRRSTSRTPLLGGIAIVIASAASMSLSQSSLGFHLLLVSIPVLLIGIIDDFKELSARPKFFVQVLAASLWVTTIPRGDLLLEQIGLPPSIAMLLSAAWIIGIINAINFIDGMDGLVAGTLTIVFIMLAILFNGNREMSIAMIIFAGTSLGFLFFNYPPAKIYLGDSGSGLFGFVLGSATTILQPSLNGSYAVLVPMLLLAYPQIDAVLAIMRRLINQRPIFKGDHSHLHHKLQKIGFTVPQSPFIIYSVVMYCAIGAYTINSLPIFPALLVLAITTGGLIGALALVFLWDKILGSRIALYNHSVINQQLSLQNKRTGTLRSFPGLLINLAKISSEFQRFTPTMTHKFAADFSALVKQHFPEGLFKSVNNNGIIIYFEQPLEITESFLNEFKSALKTMFREYQVLESEEETLSDTVVCLSNNITRGTGELDEVAKLPVKRAA